MNADHYFEIGSSHRVCQDYALSGVFMPEELDDLAYAIVSDGCSGAAHSEIGAQILCHAAKYYIDLYYFSGLFQIQNLSIISKALEKSILQKADELRKGYVIDQAALQATLMIAIATAGRQLVFVWGDGIIIEHYKDNAKVYNVITEIDYETNAPYYLATNPDAYAKKFSDTVKTLKRRTDDDNFTQEEKWPYDAPYFKEHFGPTLQSITLCSDGIKSYQDEKRKPIEIASMVPQFMDYPDYNGPFVQRNMIFLKRTMEKQKWSHHDDISSACIAL